MLAYLVVFLIASSVEISPHQVVLPHSYTIPKLSLPLILIVPTPHFAFLFALLSSIAFDDLQGYPASAFGDRKLGQNKVVWNENEELIVSYSATKFKNQSNQ